MEPLLDAARTGTEVFGTLLPMGVKKSIDKYNVRLSVSVCLSVSLSVGLTHRRRRTRSSWCKSSRTSSRSTASRCRTA
jgi:hypothetical protein